jgi:hypothetical protein
MNQEIDEDDTNRIYVIPILLRVNSDIDERDYMNFIINSILTEFISDYINSFYNESRLSGEDFNRLNKIKEDFECNICMEDKTEGILLKCNHLFCQPCIKQWLTNNKSTCPTCRKEVEI